MVCLTQMSESQKKELAKKIRLGVSKMLKNKIDFKDVNGILRDLNRIEEEILLGKSFFKVFFDDEKEIRGFYYIRLNESEKFLAPYFETEFFYSETPKSFFKCLKNAAEDLKKLAEAYPGVKSYVGYYTVGKDGEALSHAKIANRRIKEVFEGRIEFEDVFKTFAGKING